MLIMVQGAIVLFFEIMPKYRPATKAKNRIRASSYELEICEVCDLPFNDYSGNGICQVCEERQDQTDELGIKRGYAALARAIYYGEDTKQALDNVIRFGLKGSTDKQSRTA